MSTPIATRNLGAPAAARPRWPVTSSDVDAADPLDTLDSDPKWPELRLPPSSRRAPYSAAKMHLDLMRWSEKGKEDPRKMALFNTISIIEQFPPGSEAMFKQLYAQVDELLKQPGALDASDLSCIKSVMRLGKDNVRHTEGKKPRYAFEYVPPGPSYSLGDAMSKLLYSAAKEHPDAATREQAACELAAEWPRERRMEFFKHLNIPGLEAKALKGGRLGELVADTRPDGPLGAGDVEKLQTEVQKQLGDVLKVCEDDDDLRKCLEGLTPGPERDMLLAQFFTTKKDLRELKHALTALQLAGDRHWQIKNRTTFHKDKAERLAGALLSNPRITALCSILQKRAAQSQGLPGKVEQQKAYLRSDPFLDKIQMLGTPDAKTLNAKQMKFIMEQVSRTLTGETDPAKLDQGMTAELQAVFQALEKRGVATASVTNEELQTYRAQVEEALADPKVSEEEKSMLRELMPFLKDSKSFAMNTKRVVDVLRRVPLAHMGSVANATGVMSKGWALGKVAMKWLGPVGEAIGVWSNLSDMRKAVSEGNADLAEMRLYAAAAGTGAATIGLIAICAVSGPLGWVAGGLGILAAGLGLVSSFSETDPFEDTCKRWDLSSPGPPLSEQQERELAEQRRQTDAMMERWKRGDYGFQR